MFQKLLHAITSSRRSSGLEFEPPGDGASPHYRRYREDHAEEVFGYSPPETLGRAKAIQANSKYPSGMLTYQDGILSCTMCTICELKNYFTHWKKFFAWRWLYGSVRHFDGGTRFKDGMRIAKEGMLLDMHLPQSNFWGGERFLQTIHLLKKGKFIRPTYEELDTLKKQASMHKLGKWSYLYAKDHTAIKHAIQKAPCPAGVYLQKGNWYHQKKITFKPGLRGAGGHLILVVDWSDKLKAWWITDHDGKGLKLLDYNYPFAFIASVEDGQNKQKTMPMLRIIKTNASPKYYVVWLDNTKSHIPSWDLYLWGCTKGLWVVSDKVELLKEEDFNRIPLDNQSEFLLKIMKEYQSSHNPSTK